MNEENITPILLQLTPGKRIKFLRQKVLKQNQHTFCEDGIVRSGTLKSIEIERIKIGNKIADKLVHKLSLEGIICEPSVFLDKNSPCHIKIDTSKKDLIGSSTSVLEEIRKKITTLTPIKITTDEYAPIFPIHTTLLAYEANKAMLVTFKKTLCFIKGDKSSLFYLSYKNDKELIAEMNNCTISISTNIIEFCKIFVVEIIYLGSKY